jgi:redox-sensitive bicupin YhaK (pirin superfamily)
MSCELYTVGAFTTEETDPFLMCDFFGPARMAKASNADDFPIGWHPHRGMDIATYMKTGVGRHADSMGNRGTFTTPGMQWISVGSGIEHAEGGANDDLNTVPYSCMLSYYSLESCGNFNDKTIGIPNLD